MQLFFDWLQAVLADGSPILITCELTTSHVGGVKRFRTRSIVCDHVISSP